MSDSPTAIVTIDATPAGAAAIAATAPTPPKPGYKTTEFWLKVAAFALTALYASGVIPTSGSAAAIAAIAATMLGSLGYTVARTLTKAAGVLAVFIMAGMLVSSGCAALRTEVKAIANNVVTCAKADQAKAQALALQLGIQAVTSLVLTGKPDWSSIGNTAESGVGTQGLDVAACAFKDVVDKVDTLLASANQGSNAPQGLAGISTVMNAPPGSGQPALAAFLHVHALTAVN